MQGKGLTRVRKHPVGVSVNIDFGFEFNKEFLNSMEDIAFRQKPGELRESRVSEIRKNERGV